MENEITQTPEKPALSFNNAIQNSLLGAVKWAKTISILGFVFLAIMLLASFATFGIYTILFESFGSLYDDAFKDIPFDPSAFTGIFSLVIVFIFLVVIGIYFYPIYSLYKFSTELQTGIQNQNENQILAGFEFLRRHYKYIAILIFIAMGLYALQFLLMLAIGLSF